MDDLQACILTALQILSAFSVINNTYKAGCPLSTGVAAFPEILPHMAAWHKPPAGKRFSLFPQPVCIHTDKCSGRMRMLSNDYTIYIFSKSKFIFHIYFQSDAKPDRIYFFHYTIPAALFKARCTIYGMYLFLFL